MFVGTLRISTRSYEAVNDPLAGKHAFVAMCPSEVWEPVRLGREVREKRDCTPFLRISRISFTTNHQPGLDAHDGTARNTFCMQSAQRRLPKSNKALLLETADTPSNTLFHGPVKRPPGVPTRRAQVQNYLCQCRWGWLSLERARSTCVAKYQHINGELH